MNCLGVCLVRRSSNEANSKSVICFLAWCIVFHREHSEYILTIHIALLLTLSVSGSLTQMEARSEDKTAIWTILFPTLFCLAPFTQ